MKLLRSISSKVIITRFNLGQDVGRVSLEPDEIAGYAKQAGFDNIITEDDQQKALKLLEDDTTEIGLITGSFFLLNHFRPILIKKSE